MFDQHVPTFDEPRQESEAAVAAMVQALCDGLLDEAEGRLQHIARLCGRTAEEEDAILLFTVLIALQRGKAVEALCHLNNLEENRCPELRALCLHEAGDPLWEGLARDLAENSSQSHVRRAMNRLLHRVDLAEADNEASTELA